METGVYCRGYIQYGGTLSHEILYFPEERDYIDFKEQRSITKHYFFVYDLKK